MRKSTIRTTALSLFAAVIMVAPMCLRAQDAGTNAPAAPEKTAPAKHKKHSWIPFRGTVGAVDTNAMTLTVGERTFDITSETRITKNGQPAVLGDIVAGDKVGGAYKKSEDGKLDATTIHAHEKKAKSDSQN
jgi:hypothetical protein